jgi:SAM-dependent methyltransferase
MTERYASTFADERTPGRVRVAQGGVHLVGSVPLAGAEEVFRLAMARLGDRLRRVPDGETGPRTDWIVWQYPVFSSRPQFEIGPPRGSAYRALPRLRLRPSEAVGNISFDALGYADAAVASYGVFSRLKRDGIVPAGCRFQVSLPTPLAPVAAFVDVEDQAVIEPIYEARLLEEMAAILAAIPLDQLAIQWDTNFELGMAEGALPAWFTDVRAGIAERLLRLARHVPPAVELGYHLCYGDEGHRHGPPPAEPWRLVEIANILAAALDRPLNWLHLPVPAASDEGYFEPLRALMLRPETELYLGLVHPGDGAQGARRRIGLARSVLDGFGLATECGWGRMSSNRVYALVDLLAKMSTPLTFSSRRQVGFTWPAGFTRVLDEPWTHQPLEETALAYDQVEGHSWYSNLNPTVEQLAESLADGDILLDYSGGTGILLDRLRLRIFDRQIGVLIVDSSAKFLRLVLQKWKEDPAVSVRLLHFLKDERRLQTLEEVLDAPLSSGGIDAIVATNAIHLYPDLPEVLASWVRTLRPGGRVFINSGNIRNPRARRGEWILDETVWVINDLAEGLVLNDPRYAAYRPALEDTERLKRHADFRDRVFLEPRQLEFYTESLKQAGLVDIQVSEQTIVAEVDDWYELLTAYHDAVLGWVGGTERIDGKPPSENALIDRLSLMRHAIDTLFDGRPRFNACWTYIRCRRPSAHGSQINRSLAGAHVPGGER